MRNDHPTFDAGQPHLTCGVCWEVFQDELTSSPPPPDGDPSPRGLSASTWSELEKHLADKHPGG